MPQSDPSQMSEEESRRNFYYVGSEFFSWNSGKNTPNILLGLSGRIESLQIRAKEGADAIESLRQTVQQASEASGRLATALNRFTRALVVVGAIGLLLQAAYVIVTILAYLHK